MDYAVILWLLMLVPIAIGMVCMLMPSPMIAIGAMCAGVFSASILGIIAITFVLTHGAILFDASGWFFIDALSAYNLSVMLLIFCLSSLYAYVYFKEELGLDNLTLKQARQFACLWCEALGAMTVVLLSNNLGLMWVGMESTTLITAFLICVHVSRESLEAMWKYIVICSVGIAFAFLGTLFAAASAKGTALGSAHVLLWTTMRANAASLDPVLIKIAFIFLIVGYGTKAGLAPMHNWLPDAHSQAPAPVSAIFSGFMLNAALYCIMRYVPIIEPATGNSGWGLRLLVGFGIFSIIIAAAFIMFQKDLKRLLAYHSIEHLGIIALGLGLGGLGTFAALFHTLNHSLCKTLAFFAAGRLGQVFGGHDMEKMSGSLRISPVWGVGIFCSLLALIGMAPFALFMSEFQLLKAAVDTQAWGALCLFLIGASIVFVGALGHAIPLAWGAAPEGSYAPVRATFLESFLVFAPLAVLLMLGLWMPENFQKILNAAADIIRNTGDVPGFTGGVRP